MQLYSLPLSPYASRVRGAIYAKGLPIEIVPPPADWRTSPEYREVNPAVRIPVLLLDDGTVLPESGVIVEYLEDAYPMPSLRPDTAEGVARVRLIGQVADLYVMQAAVPLLPLLDAKRREEAAISAQLAKLDEGLRHLDSLLLAGEYAFPGQLTTADVWLAPLRFTVEGLMQLAGKPKFINRYKAFAAYAETARSDAALGRVWDEMTEAREEFMAARAASVA